MATAGTREGTPSWSAGSDNGATIDLRQHRVSVSGDTDWSDWETIPASGAGTGTHTVTGLVANVEHTFEVRPRNSAGFGPPASATATPSVNLRLLRRVADAPAAQTNGNDALLFFCFTAFGPFLRDTSVLGQIVIRSRLPPGETITNDKAGQIAQEEAELGKPGGIIASHPANPFSADGFSEADALLLFYSLAFGPLLLDIPVLLEIAIESLAPDHHPHGGADA